MFQESLEGIVEEEAHRQSGGVGGESEDIEIHVGVELLLLKVHGYSLAKLCSHAAEIRGAVRRRRPQQSPAEKGLVGVAAASGPADDGGVPEPVDVLPVGQQVIEGGRVGEGGLLADRRIIALLFPIRTDRRRVKADQRIPHSLAVDDAFDFGVDPRHCSLFPCD